MGAGGGILDPGYTVDKVWQEGGGLDKGLEGLSADSPKYLDFFRQPCAPHPVPSDCLTKIPPFTPSPEKRADNSPRHQDLRSTLSIEGGHPKGVSGDQL